LENGLPSAPVGEFPRICVLTIQGGGAVAIDLIGQLQGLTGPAPEDRNILPIAIAGASAGSIIATLYWVGYTPLQIRELVVKIFAEDQVDEFFGSRNVPSRLTFRQFHDKLQRLRSKKASSGFLGSIKSFVARPFRRSGPYLKAATNWGLLKSVWRSRGLFPAEGFVRKLNQMILEGPRVQRPLDAKDLDRLVTFADVRDAANAEGKPLPPLFIVVTDVAEGNIFVASSIDRDSADLPIADVVRASSSFPLFFQPWSVGPHACCIDGGVVSNFPSWIFRKRLRQSLAKSDDAFYRQYAYLPWVNIGLRLAPSRVDRALKTAKDFWSALLILLTGLGRTRLDDLLFETAVKRLAVDQGDGSQGPTDVLDFSALRDTTLVKAAFQRGREDARRQVDAGCFPLPPSRYIEPILARIVENIRSLLSPYLVSGAPVRANVFVPFESGMRMAYMLNMQGDDDAGLCFRSIEHGITGLCYRYRQPILSNMRDQQVPIGPKGEHSVAPGDPFLDQERGLKGLIRKDRSWLLSVPILDILEQTISATPHLSGDTALGVGGPIYGVLNVDAAVCYAVDNTPGGLSPDPAVQAGMPIMRVVLDSAKMAAQECSVEFSRHWIQGGG